MSGVRFVKRVGCVLLLIGVSGSGYQLTGDAQTRERGPWWPSPQGPTDQAGASNYVTPAKILEALQIPKTGQTYELGHVYEASMPQYGDRPYWITSHPVAPPQREGERAGHQGVAVQMGDGSVQSVFYNGFTEDDLTGANQGLGGIEALGVEHVKPIITRGILIDIAGSKGVPTLAPDYEVTLADVRAALARQNMTESSIGQGDAVIFNYAWSVNWSNPSKYNDSRVGVGENEGSPGIGGEVARWLIERKVSMVGADSCCVSVMPVPESGNVHHLLFLREGIFLLENMELTELTRDQVYEFLFLCLTERIKGATGSPVRPIAVR